MLKTFATDSKKPVGDGQEGWTEAVARILVTLTLASFVVSCCWFQWISCLQDADKSATCDGMA